MAKLNDKMAALATMSLAQRRRSSRAIGTSSITSMLPARPSSSVRSSARGRPSSLFGSISRIMRW